MSVAIQNLLSHNEQIALIGQSIGSTPLLHFPSLSTDTTAVYAKAEWAQLSGSVKARAAYEIIRTAIKNDLLGNGRELLDASSGNTAIAYGSICKKLNLNVTICLPRNASQRRIEILRELGVDIELTSPFEGTEGSQKRAREMYTANPDKYYYADQYSNQANWKAHYRGTALEILKQTEGRITHFVAGLGTTGTFTGTARRLKEDSETICIALQPDSALHIMEGWKHLETCDVPDIYDKEVPDIIEQVSSEDTVDMMQTIEREMGLRLSPSSAANLVGASKIALGVENGVIVTVLPDSIDRYSELELEIFGA